MLGEVEVAAAVTRVTLHGELDIVTVDDLRQLLGSVCAASPQRVLIDLSDVPFVDVLSLSTILAAADSVRERGGTLSVSGATAAVRRVVSLLNAQDVLEIRLPEPRNATA